MWTQEKAINDNQLARLTEQLYCTPERGRARAWLLAKEAGFGIYLSIVGPKSEQFQGDLPLTDGQSQNILKEITNLIEAFQKELR